MFMRRCLVLAAHCTSILCNCLKTWPSFCWVTLDWCEFVSVYNTAGFAVKDKDGSKRKKWMNQNESGGSSGRLSFWFINFALFVAVRLISVALYAPWEDEVHASWYRLKLFFFTIFHLIYFVHDLVRPECRASVVTSLQWSRDSRQHVLYG